ncbi:DASS family sodium-coupled anion symporter [Phytoactinopolyspora alkaliphila]|uniref:Sodium-dependent dicarboxylate transporter SdcS n=1 Tax=Phytoactinopolyspora alkaliphila TaxID=1783498 RepID=A0A6N9YRU8_9ACTN|nr:DASS family sodium-coupled anion symporter [Phytoactinopolyspora alkaliphila]NED97786.1 DASS family sodium-coupled anion symporter [Phytoactinopolyspora alkaliphila]
MTTSTTATPEQPSVTDDEQETGQRAIVRKRIGLALGVLLALGLYIFLPDTLSTEGKTTAAIAALMAAWWMTEAIPLAATALLPLVLFPILGVAEMSDVASPYANDIIFLFMGGFMLALAMQRWHLHRRIALAIVATVGTSPVMLIAGFMLATGLITMWVSNTATAVMMLPIGLSVLALVMQVGDGKGDTNFATALMLGIAYSASIGSVSTLIGTPPNALMRGYLSENHGITIGFGQWMAVGVPLAAVFLFIAWLILTRVVYPPKIKELAGGRELIRSELHKLGPISRGEWTVLAVFVAAALSWVVIPLAADNESIAGALPWLDNISDGGIAMAVAVALFLIPVDGKKGIAALDWDTAVKLPWGILILFGGGLSLSSQFSGSGLSAWIGERVGGLDALPVWVLILTITALVLLLTELTSNTATAAVFLPIMGGVAVGLGMDVMALVVPTALAATLAFMLPVATPPNAIAFGSGHVTIAQMIRGGVWLNVVSLVLVLFAMYGLATWVFGLSL